MKIFTKIIIGLVLALMVILGIFQYKNKNLEIQDTKEKEDVIKEEIYIDPVLIKEEKKEEVIKIEAEKVFLDVLDKKYSIQIIEGETVYKIMKNLQNKKENNFSFKVKEYPGFGVFVEEINDIKNLPGKYWIYYVNNEQAPIGISEYTLKNGDIISWRQE